MASTPHTHATTASAMSGNKKCVESHRQCRHTLVMPPVLSISTPKIVASTVMTVMTSATATNDRQR
jgi:hypothetical protein